MFCAPTFPKLETMSIPEKLAAIEGSWRGTNRLHLGDWAPENPILDSDATAEVRKRSGGQFLEVSYTWTYKGEPKEGVILVGTDPRSGTVSACWTDSFHMANQLMSCEGRETGAGGVVVRGQYKVEGHPDWGWRTEIVPGDGAFRYLMYNISPDGHEEIAVEMDLSPA